jgi:hypothetical protein
MQGTGLDKLKHELVISGFTDVQAVGTVPGLIIVRMAQLRSVGHPWCSPSLMLVASCKPAILGAGQQSGVAPEGQEARHGRSACSCAAICMEACGGCRGGRAAGR